MDEPHARLAAWATADAEGRFTIETIRPGGYPKAIHLGDRDRKIPAHIHIDVTTPGNPEQRFQMVFADDPLLEDPYWKDWVRRLGQPVLGVKGTERGVEGELRVILRPLPH
jgi:protocatechuate 3,4-dioxygenase beta subunit